MSKASNGTAAASQTAAGETTTIEVSHPDPHAPAPKIKEVQASPNPRSIFSIFDGGREYLYSAQDAEAALTIHLAEDNMLNSAGKQKIKRSGVEAPTLEGVKQVSDWTLLDVTPPDSRKSPLMRSAREWADTHEGLISISQ